MKHLPALVVDSPAASTVCARNSSARHSEQGTRWIIGCGIVLFHVAILVFLARLSPRLNFPSETASSLVLLDLPAVPAEPKTTRPDAEQKANSLLDSGSSERLGQSHAAEGREVAPQSGPTVPLIDWSGELDTVAKADAPELLAERLQKCHDAEMHGRFLVGCGKVKTPDIWDHHRGLAEYLAIGKREANGHLFDDMRDPDRDRSSVPDIAALQKVPHRPLPLAFDPRRDYFTH